MSATASSSASITSSMHNLHLPNVERLSPRVVVVRGCNPGPFTGPGTNTYIVGVGARRVLIDAGDSGVPRYLQLLEQTLRDQCGGARLSSILVTHSHPDHIGGVRSVASRVGCADGCAVRKVPWSGNDAGLALEPVSDGDRLRVDEQTTLEAVHAPGHAPDHTCWRLLEEHILFSGDNVLGAGTVVVPAHGGSMREYMASLRRLQALVSPQTRILPGHGPPVSASTIGDYIRHREEREAQVHASVAKAAPAGCTAAELVGVLYRDRFLPWELRLAATETVHNHLVHLAERGHVMCMPVRAASSAHRQDSLDAVWTVAV